MTRSMLLGSAAAMQNVFCALSALALIATMVTSADMSAERAKSMVASYVWTSSADGTVRADDTADTAAFIEPPISTARTVERTAERAPVLAGSDGQTRHALIGSASSFSTTSFPWVPASSSVRRAHLLVYRL